MTQAPPAPERPYMADGCLVIPVSAIRSADASRRNNRITVIAELPSAYAEPLFADMKRLMNGPANRKDACDEQ